MNSINFENPAQYPLSLYYTHMMQYYSPGCICNTKLAHAYVPFQYFQCIYPPMKGLESGTIFPELDRPYGMDPEYTLDQ